MKGSALSEGEGLLIKMISLWISPTKKDSHGHFWTIDAKGNRIFYGTQKQTETFIEFLRTEGIAVETVQIRTVSDRNKPVVSGRAGK